jgi:hypothetical protein
LTFFDLPESRQWPLLCSKPRRVEAMEVYMERSRLARRLKSIEHLLVTIGVALLASYLILYGRW